MAKNIRKYWSALALLGFFFFVSPVSGQTNPVDHSPTLAEEQDYAFALGLYKDGVYQIAEEQFGRFLKRYPESVRKMDALFLQNECRFYQGKFDASVQGFAEFVQDYPNSKLIPDAEFRLGDSYLKEKKPNDAIVAYKVVLDRFGDNDLAGEAAYWIGEVNLQLQDFENAVKYYSLAYENYPKNRLRDYALYSIGWTFQKKGDFAKAAESYGRFLKEFPQSSLASSAKVRIGECYYYARDYKKAIEALAQSRSTITQNDERGQADYLIAEARYQLGDYAGAEKGYDAFLNEYGDHRLRREVVFDLGWALLKQNKNADAARTFVLDTVGTDDLASASLYRYASAQKLAGSKSMALSSLKSLISRDPTGDYTDNAWFDLGVAAFESKNIVEAKDDFTRVTTGFLQSDVLPDSYMMVGGCLLAQVNFAEARGWYERALASPNASFEVKLNSSYQIAWCKYKTGILRESVEGFADFIKAYPQHPKAADARFWMAEAQYQLGDFDSALAGYKQTVASGSPERREQALYGIGWSYFKQRNHQKAIESFEQLIASYPNGSMSFDARLRIGDAYFELKDYTRAEGTYRVVMRLFPMSPGVDYAYYQLGQAVFRQEAYSDAYKQFELLIKTFPKSDLADDAQYALGWINFQRKEFEEAIGEFQKLVSTYPTSELVPRALYSTGDSYYNLKKYSEAIRSYRELVSRYPNSGYVADALNGEQYCLTAQGKQKEAVGVMDNYLKAHPNSAIGEDLVLKKGEISFGQGDYSGAEKQYRQFVSEYPKSKSVATAWYWIAKCQRSEGRPQDAVMTLEQAVKTDNASQETVARSLFELGDIYSDQKQYDRAFASYTRIGKEFKDSEVYPEALYKLGELYLENANTADAKQQFETVISRFPSSTAAIRGKLGLVQIDIEDRKYSSAEQRAKEIATTRTDEFGAQAQYLSGIASASAKDWNNAVTALLRVKYVFPSYDRWVAKSFVALGDAYRATHDSRKAKSAYESALKYKQEPETVAEARKRLGDL